MPCCGPATSPLSTPNRQVAGSSPARSIRAPVAQLEEQFGRHTTTAADQHARHERRVTMSYLTSYATRNPRVQGVGVDERSGSTCRASTAVHTCGCSSRTRRTASGGAVRRAADPSADRGLHARDLALVRADLGRGAGELAAQDRHAARSLQRFRAALDAEAELYAHREQHRHSSVACRSSPRAGTRWLSGRAPGDEPGGAGSIPAPAASAVGVAQTNVRLDNHDRGPSITTPTLTLERRCPMSYLKRLSKQRAPQSAPIPGSSQVANSAGGFAWAVDELGAAAPLPDPRLGGRQLLRR